MSGSPPAGRDDAAEAGGRAPRARGRAPRPPIVLRVLRTTGLIVLGVVLWATSAMMFSGVAQTGSWIAVAVISGFGLVVWLRSERRGDDR